MNRDGRHVLGIWDGHDAGAALVSGERVIFAINEERLSRRKLDIGFPQQSIKAALAFGGITADDVGTIAFSTSDFAKTLTRCFPSLREEYYLLRRRKKYPGPLSRFKKMAKYRITEWPPSAFTRAVSRAIIRRELQQCGFQNPNIRLVDHHAAHAATACFSSGFQDCLVLTIDGIGDALSGRIWSFHEGRLNPIDTLPGKASFGIFFEHVTNLMNMRELEDEGKVMALANFAYPVPDKDNPMLAFFSVEGTHINSHFSSTRMYRELARTLWRFPPEQFAYMAQRTLEVKVVELVRNALRQSGMRHLAYAGGVASNVKVNMLLRELPELDGIFVFPHMGDGGLAVGAAMWANYDAHDIHAYNVENVYWGTSYTEAEIRKALEQFPALLLTPCGDVVDKAAELLAHDEIVMWFQGRSEFGPRSLGCRSILARPDSMDVKDALNLKLKRRVWYQPFCPTMLHEDALLCLEGYHGPPNPFMTCAYRTRREKREKLAGVINVDGSCRPQILMGTGVDPFTRLLKEFKKRTGSGVLLNTSFNLHGEPIVCNPADALRTFSETEVRYMVMEGLLISKRQTT
jgi:carbamoyltransferase